MPPPSVSRKPARPTGQEEHISLGQRPFAVTPGSFFDDDGGTAAAIDASYGVQQEDEQSPTQGNELKAPHRDFDALVVGPSKHKPGESTRDIQVFNTAYPSQIFRPPIQSPYTLLRTDAAFEFEVGK
jgi:hypothetical protein